jgi:glycosyltransferase involved in cell wall biosynthesis
VPAALQLISTGGFYGAERVVVDLAAHLGASGWRSYIGVLESPGADMLLAAAVCPGVATARLPGDNRRPWRVVRALRDYVLEHRIQVAHSHGYKPDLYLALACLPRHVRKVSTCHTWDRDSLALRAYEYLDKLALHRFDHVALVSPHMEEDVNRAFPRLRRTSVINNGVTIGGAADAATRARLRGELGVRDGEALVVRIGRLIPRKGNNLLLRAFADVIRHRPARLVFAGDGKQRDSLAAAAVELGLANAVLFTGYRGDIPDLLRAADLWVSCSDDEGFPIALLEAMAALVPTVSTAVGAVPRVIEDGRNGWLVPPGEVGALARAMRKALEAPEHARALAESAFDDYAQDFTADAMGRRYVALYRRLLREAEWRSAIPTPTRADA